MTPDLLHAAEKLRIGTHEHDSDHDECITGTHCQRRPEHRIKGESVIMRKELEGDVLTPQISFDVGWLNTLQQ